MHPGLACVDCHAQNGGPKFTLAGTVFAGAAPDDCLGAKATIVITDADGKSIEIGANESGNFYTNLAVKMPYQAKIVSADKKKSKIMLSPQSTGDCNTCHTVTGANGAPGRITLP
jgi:mono/diheme cytochrome c family protein